VYCKQETTKTDIAECWEVKGIQTHPYVKGLIKVYMCRKFRDNTTYSFLDIKANVKMMIDRRTYTGMD